MFNSIGLDGAKNVNEAEIVCFTGGADINPELYGEPALANTGFSIERDQKDLECYIAASKRKSPPCLVGICRGAQFLNVMNGGRLWQHVTDHTRTHIIYDKSYNEQFEVTSTHHQMMIPRDSGLVLAVACVAKEKHCFGSTEFRPEGNEDFNDVEVVWYDDTRSLCFQPHPEIGHRPTLDYFTHLLDDFIIPVC
jgi:hypothetical protein